MRYARCLQCQLLFNGLFLSACMGFLCLSHSLSAQSAATLKAFADGPQLGKIEDALVGVETTITGADGVKRTQRGNGVLLRCDGFVLAPATLFRESGSNVLATYRCSVSVFLHPGSAQERRVKGTIPRFNACRDIAHHRDFLGYVVFKVQDVHVPAVRALLSDTLSPGQKMEVAWSQWNTAQGRFAPVQKRSCTIGAAATNKADTVLGRMALAEALPDLPPGAVVLTAGDVSVGMITQPVVGNKASVFDTMTLLNLATNCVTPLACPPSAEEKSAETPANTDTPAPAASSGMVRVPGGPVQLPPKLLAMQPDMEGARIACIAPFEIDKYQVTNAQYLEFWKSLPATQRANPEWRAALYPVGWGAENAPFPADLSTTPVLGVRIAAAQAYAKWKGKRLPTPYEWCLAAFGPSGGNVMPEWAQRYVADRQTAWQKAQLAHKAYLQNTPGMQLFLDPQRSGDTLRQLQIIPWLLPNPLLEQAAAWSRSICENAVEEVRAKWGDTLHVLPGGSRPYDISPYGAADMVMNAWEPMVENPMYWITAASTSHFYATYPPGSGSSPYLRVNWINQGVMVHVTRRIDRIPGQDIHADESNQAAVVVWTAAPLNTRRLISSTHYAQTHEAGNAWSSPVGIGDIFQAASNIQEVGEQLRSVTQWQVDISAGPTITDIYHFDDFTLQADGVITSYAETNGLIRRPKGQAPLTLVQTPALRLWLPAPRHAFVDMGAWPDTFEAAINPNYTGLRSQPPCVYLAPCGFRCAR